MSRSTQRATRGIHHAGLTVPNIDAARDFFVSGLGFEVVGEKPDYPAVFVSDGSVMITLWQAEDPATARRFDRRNNLGLHHLALRVDDPERLDALHQRLVERDDVSIEFSPEALNDGPTRHMMCALEGGLRIEFIAPASA
jgi:catechol 2,3-dioxygenase-like lactoylglutathione lyase family enzyme